MRDMVQIKIWRTNIEESWNEFQQVQAAIEFAAGTVQNENENFPYREDFEELYFKAVGEVEKVINLSTKKEEMRL